MPGKRSPQRSSKSPGSGGGPPRREKSSPRTSPKTSPLSSAPSDSQLKQLDATEQSVNTLRESSASPRQHGGHVTALKTGKKVKEKAYKAVDEFIQYIMKLGVFGLRKEFGEMRKEVDESITCEAFASNPNRNKYKDLVCIDSTRVVLSLESPPETDYIHASWVNMTGVETIFIATQTPLEDTVEDFWRMCFQESVKTILVLADFFENGSIVFKRYWPENDEVGEYGNFTVEVKKESQEERITAFTLELTYSQDADHPLTVTLVQITDWAGKSLVECGVNILRVLKRIVQNGCCVVQCTSGVGRSGVVIAVDTISTRLFKGEFVKIRDVVHELRTMRASSIQSANQYILIASTVLSYIKAKIPFKYQKQVTAFRADITPTANA